MNPLPILLKTAHLGVFTITSAAPPRELRRRPTRAVWWVGRGGSACRGDEKMLVDYRRHKLQTEVLYG